MNINQEQLDTFLAEVDLINQKVKDLASNKISVDDVDKFQEQKLEDKKKREEVKQRKEKEIQENKRKGRQGKGITKDFSHFCRFCHREYELETPTCWKCNRPTMTLAERQAQLEIMVEDYKFNKAKRDEKKQKWQMFQKTQASLWKKSSINYNKKWDYFVQQSEEQPQKEPIVPSNDPNFKALEADIEQRKKRRAKDTENAKRLKQKGNSSMKEGDHKKAIQFYTLALEHIKDIKSIYTNRALAYIKVKKYKKAIKDCTNVIQYMQVFEKVGESKDLMFKALTRRALSKKELKDYKEALEDVNQALKLFPNDSNAKLLKKQIESFIQHSQTVQKLIRENREKELSHEIKEEQDSQADDQKAQDIQKEIIKELAEGELAEDVKKKIEEEKNKQQKKQPEKEENPIKQIPKRLESLNQANIQYLLNLLLKNKELKNIFIASKGIEKTLDFLVTSQSSKNEALLIYLCLDGDGVGEKKVWEWGVPKLLNIILDKFKDQSKLNLSVYAFIDNIFQILVPMSLSDIYRPLMSSDKGTFEFVETMFSKLITKYKKQPQLLDNFLTLLSNLCSGDSTLKNSFLKKEKVTVIYDSLFLFILSHKSKNRLILDLKQTVYSLIANIITNLEHRKTFLLFLQQNNKIEDLKQELQLYPRSAHNFEPYIENILSVTSNALLDCPLQSEELSTAIFDRFIVNWQDYNTTIVHRALLTLGRFKYTSNKNLEKWMKTFNKMALKIDPLTNPEDKYISQVIKILNTLFQLNEPELISDIPTHLFDLFEKLIIRNQINQTLFCNTCNLIGIMIDRKNVLTEKILVITRKAIGKLVEISKEKVGNWRKSSAILLGKSSWDPKCREQLNVHHGMQVLKSIASFVIDKK